mgnify:CR=1 FL=1
MSIIIPANTLAAGGFGVDNSCRFDGSSAFMTKTPSGAGNQKLATFSIWFKRSKIDEEQFLFYSFVTNKDTRIAILADNTIFFESQTSDSIKFKLVTNRVFRDVSAWYHLVINVNSTVSSPDTNNLEMFINGVKETSFSTATYPSQNDVVYWTDSIESTLGRRNSGGNYFNGYIAETVLIDGAALDADSFGEFDEDSGIWKPIDVSGLTFGTNGFYLDFEASGNLGNDANGGADFAETGLAAIDQTTDTCTNNFCTMNPLSSGMTLTEGNTNVAGAATAKSTFGVSSGKWYVEMKATNAQTYNPIVGIATASSADSGDPGSSAHPGSFVESHGYDRSGDIKSNDNTAVQSSLTTSQSDGDIIGLAIDLDSGTKTAQWYVNGSSVGSAVTLVSNDAYVFMTYASGSQAGTGAWNFGNPSFTGTDKADGNGFGSFEYQPPSGFLALCTKNLAESG